MQPIEKLVLSAISMGEAYKIWCTFFSFLLGPVPLSFNNFFYIIEKWRFCRKPFVFKQRIFRLSPWSRAWTWRRRPATSGRAWRVCWSRPPPPPPPPPPSGGRSGRRARRSEKAPRQSRKKILLPKVHFTADFFVLDIFTWQTSSMYMVIRDICDMT